MIGGGGGPVPLAFPAPNNAFPTATSPGLVGLDPPRLMAVDELVLLTG
jgi:hypothetical protein